MATIGLVQHRAARELRSLSAGMEAALANRAIIEQAQGMVAERHGVDMDEAFSRLRRYSLSHSRRLNSVARELVEGSLSSGEVTGRRSQDSTPDP
ncbi:MAG: ANTAR domain-containing protein [Acidimicrobiales bacterium]